MISAIRSRHLSPAGWPHVSLSVLKWSKSIKITAAPVGSLFSKWRPTLPKTSGNAADVILDRRLREADATRHKKRGGENQKFLHWRLSSLSARRSASIFLRLGKACR